MESTVAPGPLGRVAYVTGHGALEAFGRGTFVPAGVTVVFHAAPGSGLFSRAGARVLEIVADQGQERFTGPTRPAAPLVMVPNYTLGGFGDLVTALELAVADLKLADAGNLYFVDDLTPGPTIRLCDDKIGACRAQGHHVCGGVFGKLGADYDQIHVVCCRVIEGESWHPPSTTDVPGDPDSRVLEKTDATTREFSSMIKVDGGDGHNVTEDPARLARAREYFDKLSPEDRSRLLIDDAKAKNWFEIYMARDFLAKEGPWGLYVYYRAQDEATRARIRRSAPLVKQLTACSDRIESFDPADPADAAWFDALPDRDRGWFAKTTDDIGAWAERRQATLARARDVLAGDGLLAPYLALLTDEDLAAAARTHPTLALQAEQVTTLAEDYLTWWADAATTDTQRSVDDIKRPEAERAALNHLLPDDGPAALTYRERARYLLSIGKGLAGYHWLRDELDVVRAHAHTHPDLAALLHHVETTRATWADAATTDEKRGELWQACTDADHQALHEEYPEITAKWEERAGL